MSIFEEKFFYASVPNKLDGALERAFLELSASAFLMADDTKFGRKSVIKYADLKEFDYILSSKELETSMLEKIRGRNRNVVLC